LENKNMKRLMTLTILSLAVATSTSLSAQVARRPGALNSFASDFQTIPVMANVPGIGATFQSYLAILNPTRSAFSVQVSLFDSSGVKHDASITLAAGEVKTYTNFLDEVFHFQGGGAVTFKAPESTGGTHNNRFIISSEVRTSGTRFSTTIPALEFAGTGSPSFVAGVTADSNFRTNVGCFNQSDAANRVKVTVFDNTGQQTLGTLDLNLPANAWGQAGVGAVVSNGYVRFEPDGAAVCYAVIVDNSTADGRFISAAEFQP
jgi:hypothetical protein